ncbi:MAG: hypothetical protein WD827_05010 [Solirubrobacterales bacterium]
MAGWVWGTMEMEAKEVREGRSALRRSLLGLLLAFVLLVVGAGTAVGATWTGVQLTGEAGKVGMFGVSCPSASLCVAVGGNNTVATSTNPTGGVADWKAAYVGEGAILTAPNSSFNGRQIRGVSCPSSELCVAVSFDGLIYASTNPTGGEAAWSTVDLDGKGPNTHMLGISCPTPSFCAASAGKGKIVTSTNPTGGVSDWSIATLDHSVELRGISCVSPTFCVAVGDDGDNTTYDGEIVSSTNPLGGAWQSVQMPGGQGGLGGVSCPSPALCVTGNLIGNLVSSTNPTGSASVWDSVDGGGSVQITGVSCISLSRCVAVDNNGDVLTSTNPTGGPGDWTFENVIPYPQVEETAANHMFGVSCPSTSLCATVVIKGQIFTSKNPFVDPPAPVDNKGKGKGKKRPKRPRTTIALRPFPGVEIKGHTYKARFRFFATNGAQVRGFACKLDGRPVKRCRSPKSYRVGLGTHVFRVRAIGWTGLKGPPEVTRFKVCNPGGPLPMCLKGQIPGFAR